jgi:predicted RNA-binding protein YlqC (UPF0109 family)
MMALSERLEEMLTTLVKEMVDYPDQVTVATVVGDGGKTVVLTIRSAKDDLGKVIGKQGRNADALRTLWEGIGSKNGARVILEVDDGNDRKKRRRNHGGGAR